jgi:ABC-2 type transport system permease protein
MLGFPVETLIGVLAGPEALSQLGVQWLYVVSHATAALIVWRAGMRRFVAFGG